MAQLIALGVPNDDISALKVKSGYEIILYQDINFGGAAYVFRSDFSCLVGLSVNGQPLNLNDWATSVVVQPSTAAKAAVMSAPITLVTPVKASSAASTTEEATNDDATIDVVLSPNPFTQNLSVKVKSKVNQYYIRVYNMNGTEVRPAQRISNGQPVNLSSLSTGMYLIKIYIGNEVITRKVIKH
jgi:hypothetical protein